MTISQFLSILRARWWVVLGVFSAIVGLAVGISLLLPKQYVASTSVVVDVKPDPVSALVNPTAALPSFMATQVDILGSDRVAMRVIKDLQLLDNPALRAQWAEDDGEKGTIEQWLVTLLQKRLDVRPSRESNVITINYKSPDPRFSATLANAYAKAYIATALELRVDPAQNFRKFFDTQSQDARDALERAQRKLSAFQQSKGIVANDERLDVENARLNDLSAQLTQLQAITAESASRQVQALGSQSDRLQEVLNNPLVAGLKADLARSEAQLQQLTQRLGDANPQVVEAKANIAELRKRIDAEVGRVTGGVGVANTINKQREVQLRRELENQRAKVLQLKAVRDDGLVLQREVENAQQVFSNLVGRLSQSSLEAQSTQSNVNVLSAAQPPSAHSSPNLLLNTALGVFVGWLVAIATALGLELMDRRVRSAEDVVLALGIPVLGTLPTPKAKRYVAGHYAVLPAPMSSALPAPNRALDI